MRPDKRQQKLDHAACGIWPSLHASSASSRSAGAPALPNVRKARLMSCAVGQDGAVRHREQAGISSRAASSASKWRATVALIVFIWSRGATPISI
jgi:hypothetical protein